MDLQQAIFPGLQIDYANRWLKIKRQRITPLYRLRSKQAQLPSVQ